MFKNAYDDQKAMKFQLCGSQHEIFPTVIKKLHFEQHNKQKTQDEKGNETVCFMRNLELFFHLHTPFRA